MGSTVVGRGCRLVFTLSTSTYQRIYQLDWNQDDRDRTDEDQFGQQTFREIREQHPFLVHGLSSVALLNCWDQLTSVRG